MNYKSLKINEDKLMEIDTANNFPSWKIGDIKFAAAPIHNVAAPYGSGYERLFKVGAWEFFGTPGTGEKLFDVLKEKEILYVPTED